MYIAKYAYNTKYIIVREIKMHERLFYDKTFNNNNIKNVLERN